MLENLYFFLVAVPMLTFTYARPRLLQVNGQVKQNGCTSDMIFKIPALIEHVSSIMTLEVGTFSSSRLTQVAGI